MGSWRKIAQGYHKKEHKAISRFEVKHCQQQQKLIQSYVKCLWMRDFLEGIVLMRPKSFQRFVKQCFAKSANTKLGLLSAGPTRVGMQAWASEGFLPVEGFLPFFPGGPKVLKFSFYPSKLKQQSFLLIISKSRGVQSPPLSPLPTPMDARSGRMIARAPSVSVINTVLLV